MGTTTAPRHLELVPDTDRDLTDQGVRVPQPRGRMLPPTDYQRDLVLSDLSTATGWEWVAELLERWARREDCPRAACGALATRGCRRWARGRWRPVDGVHAERVDAIRADQP